MCEASNALRPPALDGAPAMPAPAPAPAPLPTPLCRRLSADEASAPAPAAATPASSPPPAPTPKPPLANSKPRPPSAPADADEREPAPPPHSNGTGDSPDPTPAADPPPASAPAADPQKRVDAAEPRPATVDESADVAEAAPTPPPEPTAASESNATDAKSEEPEPERATKPQQLARPDAESPAERERLNGDESPRIGADSTTLSENGPATVAPEADVERTADDVKVAVASSPPPRKKTEIKPKSTLKLATVTPTMSRKRKSDAKPASKAPKKDGPSPPKRLAPSPSEDATKDDPEATSDGRAGKRNRTKVQPYQSPAPELAIVAKLSVGRGGSTPTKTADDKLIVFYKNEFLAVRNAEGGFYVCQTMQNVYRSSRKIKIRWLSQDKNADPTGEIYKPDFYDVTDIECVLTTLSLQRAGSAGLKLGAAELARTQSILGRALAAERGEPAPDAGVTEEHPDGLDLSLYKDESQLEKKKQRGARKRPHPKSSPRNPKNNLNDSINDSNKSPKKRSSLSSKKRKTKSPKVKSSKSKLLKKSSSKDKQNSNNSLPPISASTTNKTATASGKVVSGVKGVKKSSKNSSGKSSIARAKKSSKISKVAKATQLASTPSTSTGKTTRTPRKPPSKK